PFLAALLASATILTHAALTYSGVPSFIGPLVVSFGLLLLAIVRQELTLLDNARAHREQWADQARVLALGETNRRMEEFLNIASHELKTPLASLRGNTELLVRRLHTVQPLNVDTAGLVRLVAMEQGVLERSTVSLDRIGRLINDQLDVARIREGQLELRREPCDLGSIVQEAVDEQQLVAAPRPIHLLLPAARPVPVLADAVRIGQVVTNYLTNALKYSREDRHVEVCLEVEGPVAHVSVRDEGIGMPA